MVRRETVLRGETGRKTNTQQEQGQKRGMRIELQEPCRILAVQLCELNRFAALRGSSKRCGGGLRGPVHPHVHGLLHVHFLLAARLFLVPLSRLIVAPVWVDEEVAVDVKVEAASGEFFVDVEVDVDMRRDVGNGSASRRGLASRPGRRSVSAGSGSGAG